MTDNRSWVDRHRPETWSDIQGNNAAIKRIRDWIENFEGGDEAQLLVGPPGVGKTTTAFVASKQYDLPLAQTNASDARKTEDLKELAGMIQSTPVDGGQQLLLIDEVDSMHHNVNKQLLYDALDNPKNPIIFTANEEYDVPDGIKNRVNTEKFSLGKRSRRAKLNEIAERENLDLDEHDMDKLASRPDLRSAINDLQTWSEYGTPPGGDDRTWSQGEFDAIPEILGGNKYPDDDMNPEDLVIWLDQAVRKEYRGLEAGVAYDCLSRADIWLGRAQSTRDYKWWKHASEIARMVAEVRRTEAYSGYIPGLFPDWFRHKNDSVNKKEPSATARVYKKLKGYDDERFTFTGSYLQFKEVYLQLLQNLDVEERRELALAHRLEGDELEILNLKKEEYEEWASGEDSSVQDYEAQSQSVLDF